MFLLSYMLRKKETYCKRILMYGIVAVSLTSEQMRVLTCFWKTIYRKNFYFYIYVVLDD